MVYARGMDEFPGRVNDFDWRALVHDVRASLQSIDAAANLGLESTSDGVRQAALQDIAGSAAALEWQLGELLQGVEPQTSRETVELDLWAAAALRALHALAGQQHKRLLLDTAPGACALVSTNRATLSRILQNLVVNAIRYSESETVLVELRADGLHIQLTVRNGASRLTGGDRGLVFASGGRAANARHCAGPDQRALRGNGLGVTIANSLAASLGGVARVEWCPRPNGLVEFQSSAKLPLESQCIPLTAFPARHLAVLYDARPVERAVLARQLRRLGWRVSTRTSEVARLELRDPHGQCASRLLLSDVRVGDPPTLRTVVEGLLGTRHSGEHLLLVDDSRVALAGLADLAVPLGFASVRCANDPVTALRLVADAMFDHAIIDLRLGASSGRELAERLRDRVPNTILVSADATADVQPRPGSSAELAALLGRAVLPVADEHAPPGMVLAELADQLGAMIEQIRTGSGDLDLELHTLVGTCRVWRLESLAEQLQATRSTLRKDPESAIEQLITARSALARFGLRQAPRDADSAGRGRRGEDAAPCA